jgi:hypothetical protein
MNTDRMKLAADAQQRVDQYLDAVERALEKSGRPRDERRGITDEVEAQILEMLADRAGFQPTVSDVEAVLSELDPPEAYAEEPGGASPAAAPAAPPSPAVRPHFSRAAIVGACCMALTFVTLVPLLAIGAPLIAYRALAVEAPESPGGPPAAPSPHAEPAPGARVKWAPVIMVIPLGLALLAGPAATTILGLAAISHIRKSAGWIYGMGLALADALVFPLLALDVLTVLLFARLDLWSPPGTRLAMGMVVAVAADVIIVWVLWRGLGGKGVAGAETGNRRTLGLVAFVLCVVGLLLMVPLLTLGFVRDICFVAFLGCEIAAVVCGILAWRATALARIATIGSSVLMVVALVLLAP